MDNTINNNKKALDFIQDNSRLVTRMLANPQRLGKNWTTFILQDMGKHGWDLYFIQGGNNIDTSLEQFCKTTGISIVTGERLPD